MNHPACKVECAQNQDIPAMLSLEKRYFDPYWYSEPEFIHKLIEKDPMMFRVCKINNEIRGYYWVIPLENSIWKQVLSGRINESEAMGHIRSFSEKNLYLYICSVIVDLADKQHKRFTKALVRDFGKLFVLDQGPNAPDIKAIGAFTISDGGRRLLERSNFAYKGNFTAGGKPVRSYSINRSILAQQVRDIQAGKQPKKIA